MSLKIPVGILIACLIAAGGIMVASSETMAKKLYDLQVLPRPERLSELYFTNYTKLPAAVKAGSPQAITATLHNQEHQDITYHYSLLIQPQGGEVQLLRQGDITLRQGEKQPVESAFIVPHFTGRAKISLVLTYTSTPIGEVNAREQSQSISYWVKVSATGAGGR